MGQTIVIFRAENMSESKGGLIFCIVCGSLHHGKGHYDFVARKNTSKLCRICLMPKHFAGACNVDLRCAFCDGNHHAAIHSMAALESGNNEESEEYSDVKVVQRQKKFIPKYCKICATGKQLKFADMQK